MVAKVMQGISATAAAMLIISTPAVVNAMGYNPGAASSYFLTSDGGCDSYDPTSVDWNAVKDDIINYLGSGESGYGPDRITAERVAPILVC